MNHFVSKELYSLVWKEDLHVSTWHMYAHTQSELNYNKGGKLGIVETGKPK